MNNNLSLLNKEYIIGDEKLDIFKRYGELSENTDFALLLGATSYRNAKNNKNIGLWWTKSKYYNNEIYAINEYGTKTPFFPYNRDISIRPVTRYSQIQNDSRFVLSNGNVATIIYGEYPQEIANEDLTYELESMFNMKMLKTTGKEYTVDFNLTTNYHSSFEAISYVEFEYKNKKYIRYIANCDSIGKRLSDGRNVIYNGIYWLEVTPIIWYVDLKRDIAITQKSILSGIQYNDEAYVHNHFYKNDIKKYMNKYLSKEIIPNYSNTRKLIKE